MLSTSSIARLRPGRMMQLAAALLLALAVAAAPSVAKADPAAAKVNLPPLCPAAYPVASIKVNSKATGWTVVQGSTPVPFKVKVLGVVNNLPSAGRQIIMVKIDPNWKPIRDAGGIWQGMSGSPVYAGDGRLLGAVSFIPANSGSPFGGLTPASEMLPLLNLPPAPLPTPQNPGKIQTAKIEGASAPRAFTSAEKAQLATAGVPQTVLDAGLKPLQTPYYASGVTASALPGLRKELARRGFTNPVYARPAGPAAAKLEPAAAPAPTPSRPVLAPGDNYVSAITAGDVGIDGVGTVTLTCGNKVLAFGHGMDNAGNINQSAHTAVAVNIQPDVIPHKIAVTGPQVGRNDQDRPTGVRALIGAAVPYAPIYSNFYVEATRTMRQVVTRVNESKYMGLASYVQSQQNIIRGLNADGHGSVGFGMSVSGTNALNQPFGFNRSDVIADRGDLGPPLSFLVGLEVGHRLDAIYQNPFLAAKFNAVYLTMYPTAQYRGATLRRLLIRQGATYVPITDASRLRIPAGSQVDVRAEYQPRIGGAIVTSQFGLKAPAQRGAADLGVGSGEGVPPGLVFINGATSFNEVVQSVATNDRRNIATLRVGGIAPLPIPGGPPQPPAVGQVSTTVAVPGWSVFGNLLYHVAIV